MKQSILEYLSILVGCTMVSIGFVFFINPYKFVPGGVFGTSIVLHTLMPQLQVGTYGYMLGIPLLVMSYFLLGKGIGARTLFATLASPCIMNVVSTLAYPSAEALQRLSPTELCGGLVNLSSEIDEEYSDWVSGTNGKEHVLLTPGQDVQLLADGKLKVAGVDTQDLVSWRDGYFYFDNVELYDIMQTIGPIKNLNMMQKVKVTKKDNTLYVSPI